MNLRGPPSPPDGTSWSWSRIIILQNEEFCTRDFWNETGKGQNQRLVLTNSLGGKKGRKK
jgi:hypothetical protein